MAEMSMSFTIFLNSLAQTCQQAIIFTY